MLPYFDEMEKACGEMGLSLFEFYELTPRQFQNLFTGYLGKEEAKTRERWNQTRWVAFWSARAVLKKSATPERMLKFPWDNEIIENNGVPTEEEIKEMRATWAEIDKKNAKTGN